MAMAAAPGPPASCGTAAIIVDYPEDGSIFPPEITPPTFLWRDNAKGVSAWKIDISFTDGAATIHATSKGEHLRIGKIDPDCVADTNQPPRLTGSLAAAHSWTPDAATWQTIKRHSVSGPAKVGIAGHSLSAPGIAVSRGQIAVRTSRDPVGAPIFYRDVPLMPGEAEKGVIKPLTAEALPLVAWRIRNVGEPASRIVMDNLPTCANCHSFSADGKTFGMDLDGFGANRGLYMLAKVRPDTQIGKQNLVQWASPEGKLKGGVRIGFMSQVSPDGRYVATTINPAALADPTREPPSNYYVANFKDYRFLQVFYPTRGVVSWYSAETGVLRALPGADDPRFVQMGAVWGPDSGYLVFARAEARDPYPPGAPLAQFAGDPNEMAMQYDLYRIPFNGGRGGEPEPIEGASRNGMSNSFPKVSPDGRWIVFVQSRNGQLMRPDSQLYIVPAAGGVARRMRSNTSRMNSWHSFSPNGRWMVFSSKARSPYTQMYVTHIDENGDDSPAILIDNSTAANRAVNIPEFVNTPPDGLRAIGGPVLDYYRLVNSAAYLQKSAQYEAAAAKWRQALELEPDDEISHRNLGEALLMSGHRQEAGPHFEKADELRLRAAVEADPASAQVRNGLGALLVRNGRLEEAVEQFEKAVTLKPDFAEARANLASALLKQGKPGESLAELRLALAANPDYPPAHYNLGLLYSRQGDAQAAIAEWRRAVELDPKYAEAHIGLADALDAQGQTAEAVAHWRAGVELEPGDAVTLRRLAWALATSQAAPVRNGADALAFAVRAVEIAGGDDARILDALAAAYAEKGQFAEAALTARRALAQAAQEPELAAAIKARISLYEARKPFREEAPKP
jgi:tetratricopeptide (TPR) repeat protein